MSLLWSNRAALNTPWNPWGDELFRIDGDHVTLYDSTHITDAVLQSKFDLVNRTPKQLTLAKMPTPTPNNAFFRGHGSMYFGAGMLLATGTWSAAIPAQSTHYFVVKSPAVFSASNLLFDGLVVGQRQGAYLYTGGRLAAIAATSQYTPAVYPTSSLIVGCIVFNDPTSLIYVNSATPSSTAGTTGSRTPTGLTIGNAYAAAGDYPLFGDVAEHAVFGRIDAPATVVRTLRYLGDKYGGTIA